MTRKPTYEELEERVKELEKADQVEEVFGQSPVKYRVVFETAKDAIFVSDATGRFVDVNEAACKSLGYSKEELLKLSIMEIDADAMGYEAFLKVRDGLTERVTF